MARDSLWNQDWDGMVARLGGAKDLVAGPPRLLSARAGSAMRSICCGCFSPTAWARAACARPWHATVAWAAATGLADVSNVALLNRLRRPGDWLARLVGPVLGSTAPAVSQGRLIRLVDGTAVAKAGAAAGKGNHLWRIHRAYRKPERMAAVLQAGAAVVVRAGWRSARWPREDGTPFDLIDALDEATGAELIDQPIWLGRKSGAPLAPRLVALKKPAQAAARRKARRDAPRERHQVSRATLVAADWVILITSLTPKPCSTQDGLALYRLRWRIELGFKRLKSVLGLRRPPGTDARSARPYLLAHLLLILLLKPLSKAFEDSPRWANAA